jgi:hypothetical protein
VRETVRVFPIPKRSRVSSAERITATHPLTQPTAGSVSSLCQAYGAPTLVAVEVLDLRASGVLRHFAIRTFVRYCRQACGRHRCTSAPLGTSRAAKTSASTKRHHRSSAIQSAARDLRTSTPTRRSGCVSADHATRRQPSPTRGWHRFRRPLPDPRHRPRRHHQQTQTTQQATKYASPTECHLGSRFLRRRNAKFPLLGRHFRASTHRSHRSAVNELG